MTALRDAVTNYLRALDLLRTPYVQTARNAPSEPQVRADRERAVREAEQALRDAVATCTECRGEGLTPGRCGRCGL